ncbi:MAG: UDP-N-acetylmuramoyl-tripeptide--D-alanyl-D-alanine ligase [Canibacter sp.]
MIALTLSEIARAVSGSLALGSSSASEDTVVDGISQTDSREVGEGQIFFARRGEETDGHRFVSSAIDRGAVLIVAERVTDDRRPHIIVNDSTEALGVLAKHVVHAVHAAGTLSIIGITGSNGKTTTKNLVGSMLSQLGETVASEKSFNNEVGGPLTMLRVTDSTQFLVAEMGASAPGEIHRLTHMAPPDIGVVLTVGFAHAGEFGGIETTFRTKSEMVDELSSNSVAVLNSDDPRVRSMAELTDARVRLFGTDERADVQASNISSDAQGTSFVLTIDGEEREVRFPVLGEHHVTNALAATTIAYELGLDLATIVDVLERTTRPAKWRMEVIPCKDGITIVNDAYNASPDSMSAALKTLAQIGKPNGRTVAVLGEMSELGEFSGEAHDQIGIQAVRLRISETVVVGDSVRRMYISAVNEGAWEDEAAKYFPRTDEALDYLIRSIRPHDTVLVKSSNSAGLRFLGDQLGEALA